MEEKVVNNSLQVVASIMITVGITLIGIGLIESQSNKVLSNTPNTIVVDTVKVPTISGIKKTPVLDNKNIKYNKITTTPKKNIIKPSVKNIKKLTLNPNRTINVYGTIGENALRAANEISEMNKQNNDPIFLKLNSPGGSVIKGAVLVSAMQASTAPVYTICYAFCASMAAMIHQYGIKRYATDRTMLMFHPASVGTQGDVDRIHSFINSIQRYVSKMEIEVAHRLGTTFEKYKQLIVNEYWID